MGRPRLAYASQGIATRVLQLTARPQHPKRCQCAVCRWWKLLTAKDAALRFQAEKYLTDKRDGRPAQSVIQQDTRESTRALDFGDIPLPSSDARTTGQPN
jgi:hypothetical protein